MLDFIPKDNDDRYNDTFTYFYVLCIQESRVDLENKMK